MLNLIQNKLFLIGLIGLTVLAGGGYYAYNYFENSPDRVSLKSLEKLLSYSSLSLEIKSKTSFSSQNLYDKLPTNYESLPFTLKDKISIFFDYKSNVEAYSTSQFAIEGSLTLSSDSLPFEISADYFMNEKYLYLKPTNLSFLTLFMPKEIVNSFLNRWVRINYHQTNQKFLLQDSKQYNFLLPAQSYYDLLSQREKIINSLMKTKVFTAKDAGKESINGIETRKIIISLNKDKIIPFLKELNNYLSPSYKLSEKDLKDFEEELKKVEQLPNFELYVDNNKDVRKLSVNYEFSAPDLKGPIALELEFFFDNFNKNFNLKDKEPKDYIDFEKIMSGASNLNFSLPSSSSNYFEENKETSTLDFSTSSFQQFNPLENFQKTGDDVFKNLQDVQNKIFQNLGR